MAHKKSEKQYVLCVRNDGYPVSLEVRKVYGWIPDAKAAAHGLVRVIDESGEDYLYPRDFFVPLDSPRHAAEAFATHCTTSLVSGSRARKLA